MRTRPLRSGGVHQKEVHPAPDKQRSRSCSESPCRTAKSSRLIRCTVTQIWLAGIVEKGGEHSLFQIKGNQGLLLRPKAWTLCRTPPFADTQCGTRSRLKPAPSTLLCHRTPEGGLFCAQFAKERQPDSQEDRTVSIESRAIICPVKGRKTTPPRNGWPWIREYQRSNRNHCGADAQMGEDACAAATPNLLPTWACWCGCCAADGLAGSL